MIGFSSSSLLVIISVVLGLAALGFEIALRRWFGFGNPLLYIPDDDIGYLLAPNQDVKRFGNRILINAYSMRGTAIAPTPSPNTLRVMMLGDSIANGGWWTAQGQTISALLQNNLQRSAQEQGFTAVEVLNASANSWGPRNERAYLQHYGTFGSGLILLIINTDDLFATAPTPVQVGRDRNYPARKPPLALAEVVGRYLLPAGSIPELEMVQAEGGDRVGKNLEAIQGIQSLAARHQAQTLLVMTPLLREVGTPGPRDYELQARDRLFQFTQQQAIPYLDVLPLLNQRDDAATLYRDHIHFNAEGNRVIAQAIMTELMKGAIANRNIS
jgi:hypothetical protein